VALATSPVGDAAIEVCLMPILGCTDPDAPNYLSEAQADDGSCIYQGCMNSIAPNYNPSATQPISGIACTVGVAAEDCGAVPLGGCDAVIEGCLIPGAPNYNAAANYDPEAASGGSSCILVGCMNPGAANYKSWATSEQVPSPCDLTYSGCTDSLALNYYSKAAEYGLSLPICEYAGCADTTYFSYDPLATVHELTRCVRRQEGCMDPAAWYNYGGPNINVDDGSCVYAGCTEPGRVKYSPLNTLQLYTDTYEDPVFEYCGGLALPPPPPAPLDLANTVSMQMVLNATCAELIEILDVETIDDVIAVLSIGFSSVVSSFGVGSDRVFFGIPKCSEQTGRALSISDTDIVAEIDMAVPDDKEPSDLVQDLQTVSLDAWSEALGVPVGFILICLYDADGNLRCNLPPPIPPPSLPPSPASPPPLAPPDDSGVPVMIIIIIVLVVLVIILAVVAVVFVQRRKKRIEGSTVTPQVDNRVTVPPPPLPATTTE